jgi:hypothetical protein
MPEFFGLKNKLGNALDLNKSSSSNINQNKTQCCDDNKKT